MPVLKVRYFRVGNPAGFVIIGLIYLAAIGRVFCLDLIYGIGVAVGLPTLLVAVFSTVT
ncbi:MAG TPA: hypothetical protein VE242_14505 [Chthoniobacterales bacterium]|nr:hypothetical protein [Chthoniobacterales bacterium]